MRRTFPSCLVVVALLALGCDGDETAAPSGGAANGGSAGVASAGRAGASAGAGAGGSAGAGPGGSAGAGAGSGSGGSAVSGSGGSAGASAAAGSGGEAAAGANADAGAGGSAGSGGGGAGAGGSGNGGSGAGGSGASGAGGGGAGEGGAAGANAGGTGGGGKTGGAGAASVCGDGARASDEPCEGGDFAGATCASVGLGSLPRGPDGAPLVATGPGHLVCSATCEVDKSLCEPAFQSIGYVLGPTEGAPGRHDFSENFAWDAAARVYRTTGISFSVALGLAAGAPVPVGPTLLATTGGGDTRDALPGFVPPDYPSLHVNEPGLAAPFYEPCWDHDCESAPTVAPYPARAKRRMPLLLRQTTGTAHVPGGGRPWMAARGKVRLVVAVVYADQPMPAADVASLFAPEGLATGTSFAAVPPWFAARSAERALPKGVEIEVVWSGKQVKIPDDQLPSDYGSCIFANWKSLVTPSVALEPNDVLVQLYWAKPGTPCASHVLRDSRSYVLFARPDFFQRPGLVVSAAHELMHLFGASDKYTETALPGPDGKLHGCLFEGAAYDPHDIMCHRVVDVLPSGEATGFVNPPLPALGVWPLTAREVGWEDLDGDGQLEVEDACPWDGGC